MKEQYILRLVHISYSLFVDSMDVFFLCDISYFVIMKISGLYRNLKIEKTNGKWTNEQCLILEYSLLNSKYNWLWLRTIYSFIMYVHEIKLIKLILRHVLIVNSSSVFRIHFQIISVIAIMYIIWIYKYIHWLYWCFYFL